MQGRNNVTSPALEIKSLDIYQISTVNNTLYLCKYTCRLALTDLLMDFLRSAQCSSVPKRFFQGFETYQIHIIWQHTFSVHNYRSYVV